MLFFSQNSAQGKQRSTCMALSKAWSGLRADHGVIKPNDCSADEAVVSQQLGNKELGQANHCALRRFGVHALTSFLCSFGVSCGRVVRMWKTWISICRFGFVLLASIGGEHQSDVFPLRFLPKADRGTGGHKHARSSLPRRISIPISILDHRETCSQSV